MVNDAKLAEGACTAWCPNVNTTLQRGMLSECKHHIAECGGTCCQNVNTTLWRHMLSEYKDQIAERNTRMLSECKHHIVEGHAVRM